MARAGLPIAWNPRTAPGTGQRTPAPVQAAGAGARGQGRRGGGRGGAGGAAAQANQPRPEVGSELVLRNLADGRQRILNDVNDYTFAKDGKLLIYSTISKIASANGLFALPPGASAPPLPLLRGKGKFAKMTWDEKQHQLVFLSDRDTAGAKQPTWKLYYWSRKPSDEIARLAQIQVALPVTSVALGGLTNVMGLLQAPLVDSAVEMIGCRLAQLQARLGAQRSRRPYFFTGWLQDILRSGPPCPAGSGAAATVRCRGSPYARSTRRRTSHARPVALEG